VLFYSEYFIINNDNKIVKYLNLKGRAMSTPLHIELLRHQLIRDRLLAAYPDLDQETLLDTLEGASGLKEMLSAITRAYLDDRAFDAALKQRLDDMRIRLSRLESATSNKRDLIAAVMGKAELRKVTEPDFTLSLRDVPRGLSVSDEAEIPETYWLPQPAKLDRQAVLRDLRGDVVIPGAALNNGGKTISVRTQ